MTETLLTPSSIKLYGRVLNDLTYVDDTPTIGANNFLHRQLAGGPVHKIIGTTTQVAGGPISSTVSNVSSTTQLEDEMRVESDTSAGQVFVPGTSIVVGSITANSFDVDILPLIAQPNFKVNVYLKINFARIYAFTFEGAIYSLPKPAIFVVHGPGLLIKVKKHRSSVDASGVVAREWEFAGVDSVSYWEYEKGDFSIRFDTEAGPFEQILLSAAIRGADMGDRSGANLGIRSGANLSGANVSGANLSGANLSGANLRNR